MILEPVDLLLHVRNVIFQLPYSSILFELGDD